MQDVQSPVSEYKEKLILPHTVLILDDNASVLFSGHVTIDQVNEILKTLWPYRASGSWAVKTFIN